MPFTGQLGTAKSALGSLELGAAPSSPPPPPPPPAAVGSAATVGISDVPIRGVPWNRTFLFSIPLWSTAPPPPLPPPPPPPPQALPVGTGVIPLIGAPWNVRGRFPLPPRDRQPPPPPVPLLPPPPSFWSVPIRGVPWTKFRVDSPPRPTFTPPPPPIVAIAPPVVIGPPIRGVPWINTYIIPSPGQQSPPPPPPPAQNTNTLYPPPAFLGIPIRGVPWQLHLGAGAVGTGATTIPPAPPPAPPPVNPPPPTHVGQQKEYIARQPQVEDRRQGRFFEITTSAINSLQRGGYLFKTGPDNWAVQSGATPLPRNPVATDDFSQGYVVGSLIINTTSQQAFICLNPATGSAVWMPISEPGGSSPPPATGGVTGTFP